MSDPFFTFLSPFLTHLNVDKVKKAIYNLNLKIKKGEKNG